MSVPVLDASGKPDQSGTPHEARPRRNYGRWRAASLITVYVLFAAHIVHWRVTGKTLAPLELNEVMYTLELGIITAGFLFMSFLVLGTVIFGRFFCSWACHIMALQDLCAWVLGKFRIRAKPIRSRVLLLVAPLTALYMFVWPQVVRTYHEGALPSFHLATDADGWASLTTNNFWRNLPSAPIIVLTFLVCGFLIVYVLGTRTFCTFVCPYGAIFGLADRLSPGRIKVSDACRQCGECTAVCTSGVRVHEEVKRHGTIVNPACLKDLDCVAHCPQGALSYGIARPALFKSLTSGGRFGLPFDFSLREEGLMAIVFVVVTFSFRGLYSRVPFLLSLALAGIVAYLVVTAVRLITRPNVVLARVHFKVRGATTASGRAFALIMVGVAAFVAHSAFIRFHEYSGLRFAGAAGDDGTGEAIEHLVTADRYGLILNERVLGRLAALSLQREGYDAADAYARRLLASQPYDHHARLHLAQSLMARNRFIEADEQLQTLLVHCDDASLESMSARTAGHQALAESLIRQGRFSESAAQLRLALDLDPDRADLHAELGSVLAEQGRIEEGVTSLKAALRLDPAMAQGHYNLGTLLGVLRRFDEAATCFERASELSPADDTILNNLGYALLQMGEFERARTCLEKAIRLNASNADAHFNLANVFAERGQFEAASSCMRRAAELDRRYARLLQETGP